MESSRSPRKEQEKMRRLVLMIGVLMMLVLVSAGVALAVRKTCGDIPCRGTNNDDVLYERIGNGARDRILGLDGDDDMDAALYDDDQDRLEGAKGRDRIVVNDGDARDTANGGRGRDVCRVDAGDSRSSCERVDVEAAGAEPAGSATSQPTSPEKESTAPGERTGQEE
jgi:hypothetical protein